MDSGIRRNRKEWAHECHADQKAIAKIAANKDSETMTMFDPARPTVRPSNGTCATKTNLHCNDYSIVHVNE